MHYNGKEVHARVHEGMHKGIHKGMHVGGANGTCILMKTPFIKITCKMHILVKGEECHTYSQN